MADYAILASHPVCSSLLVGIRLDAFDESTATDHAFHLTHSYFIPGLHLPYKALSKEGDYLVVYSYNGYTRITLLPASSYDEAVRVMAQLKNHGRVVTPDQPIA